MVTEVDPDGVAAERGFKTGDVILEVGGKTVANPADVRKALADARKDGKRTVLMRVKSGDATHFVARAGSAAPDRNGACRRHPSPPPAVRTTGTGQSPVPTP